MRTMSRHHVVSAFLVCSAAWTAHDPLPMSVVAFAAQSAFLGQPAPGLTPARFAPGVVSTDGAIELNGVFSPDGREFFFTRVVDKVPTMFHARFGDGNWTAPRPLLVYANQERAPAVDMFVSPDGKELFFLGQHAHEYAKELDSDLWVSQLVDGNWAAARVLPPPIWTRSFEGYPVVVADGSLYFFSDRPGGHGDGDVYRARRLAGGGFDKPVNIGPPINSEHSEGDAFVAPDESYLILTAIRPGGFGQSDLYVSFRGKDGRWQPPANLGNTINTAQTEYCPMVTPDGKFLFFSRRQEDQAGDVYWVDLKILDRFRH
jgi:hypothetical protein